MAYFDYNATHPILSEVKEKITDWLDYWQNPSAKYRPAMKVKSFIEEVREIIAAEFKVHFRQISFTSGGTEGNHLLLRGLAKQYLNKGEAILASKVEHPSLIGALDCLEAEGYKIIYVELDQNGKPLLSDFEEKIKQVKLATFMLANNETGVINDLAYIREKCLANKVLLHADMVQALGKTEIDLNLVDAATFSGHKIGSFKGTGFIYIKKDLKIKPLIVGGEQEKKNRPGTENVLGILSLGEAIKELKHLKTGVLDLRDYFEKGLVGLNCRINCQNVKRINNTSSVTFFNSDGQSMILKLDLLNHFASMGAACSSGSTKPSPVLLACGFSEKEAKETLRFSFGRYNNLSEINSLLDTIKKVLRG